ncbi:MAG: pseudomurein-binding repeat-containing protein [Methanobacteriaceae archaeon]|nr:pseudomurein-binding repeat-containing protein [Methanobacteriaceae archaeon]
MNILSLEQYREMVDEVIEFKNQNGIMPDYAVIDGCRIEKQSYINMIERVNKFILEMGRNPRSVEIEDIDYCI